jgi:hypothetical protein
MQAIQLVVIVTLLRQQTGDSSEWLRSPAVIVSSSNFSQLLGPSRVRKRVICEGSIGKRYWKYSSPQKYCQYGFSTQPLPVDLLAQPVQLVAQIDQVHQLQTKQVVLWCVRSRFRSHPKTPALAGTSAIIVQYWTTHKINNSL